MPASEITRDHQKIQSWITEHGGKPAVVNGTEDNDNGGGLLRVKFDESHNDLVELDWREFFQTFDQNGLSFLYQSDPKESRFFKFIEQ